MIPIIALHDITRRLGGEAVLQDVSLSLPAGQSCAIIGGSGSGKSTLLNLIGLLDQPCHGRLVLDGCELAHADDDQRAIIRNRLLGFVFQSFNLLPRLSVLDNVALPLSYRGICLASARQLAKAQLEKVGLEHRAKYRPAHLSGGQRQRVAIARALVTEPRILLADEPTGNLDGETARDIIGLLTKLNREQCMTLLVVTHDPTIARCMDRCLLVRNGGVFDA
ncbi:ABC transporter ATP-binding protein [Pseudomonas vlassakiae]|uniref:ABC transporter ATP-binding protein n=1 Tax=Pseudomonas TaxID=286 RepID=UPI0006D461E7|nr:MULTISPECIES: ABC transporter ATP-binding protein [Pseudomonas]MCU0123637.1 ABC transporter ATP-binding protein [Pseudomonas vlassakiae]HCV39904.1 ABC transporter ATP-binding protein [Pseudomonas sp.]